MIAIISLLVSILLPSLQKAKRLAQQVVCQGNLRGLGVAHLIYAEDNDGTLCFNYLAYTHMIHLRRSILDPDTGLFFPKYIASPELLYCPTQSKPWPGFSGNRIVPVDGETGQWPWFITLSPGLETQMIGYTWYVANNPIAMGVPLPSALDEIETPTETPLMSDIMFGYSESLSSNVNVWFETDFGAGMNIIYADGHVEFVPKEDALEDGPKVWTVGNYVYFW